MRHIESKIQQQCVAWFRLQYPQYASLLFAVPNGGWRFKREAAIMKSEGVLPGVADMLLLKANSTHHGLCIEFKTLKGRQQETQKAFQQNVEASGYRYALARSLDDFISLINGYLMG